MPLLITERREMFKRKKRADFKPLLDELEGLAQTQLHEQSAEDDIRLTARDRELIARLKRDAAFKKAYVRRSSAEHDIRAAVSSARMELSTYLLLLVILPLIALAYTFYHQSSSRIECSKLSRNSIQYLEQSGETLPLSCTIGR